jgi:hypothetical protein
MVFLVCTLLPSCMDSRKISCVINLYTLESSSRSIRLINTCLHRLYLLFTVCFICVIICGMETQPFQASALQAPLREGI